MAYWLDLCGTMKCHPVFSIAHLKPCPPPSTDPYQREPVQQPVIVEGEEEWEAAEILAKSIQGRGRHKGIFYLVRWKGFNDQTKDSWEPIAHFAHAKEKI